MYRHWWKSVLRVQYRPLQHFLLCESSNQMLAGKYMQWSVAITQCRDYYGRFSRVPLHINPAEQDKHKIPLSEYVQNNIQSVNREVLEETMRVNKALAKAKKVQKSTSSRINEESGVHPGDVAPLKRHQNKYRRRSQEEEERAADGDGEYQGSAGKGNGFENKPIMKSAKAMEARGMTGPSVERLSESDQKLLKDVHTDSYADVQYIYKKFMQQCSSTKMRTQHDLVLLEGPKLVAEALISGLMPVAIYYSRKASLLAMMPRRFSDDEKLERLNTYKLIRTRYKLISTWSSVVKGQGLLGVFRLSDAAAAPRRQLQQPSPLQTTDVDEQQLHLHEDEAGAEAGAGPTRARVCLLLDGVREPGNVGAILRTAAAVGATTVVMTKGCCDPWSGKVLRAAAGAHFCLNIVHSVPWEQVYTCVGRNPHVFIADVCNTDRDAMREDEGVDYRYEEDDEAETQDEDAVIRGRKRREQKEGLMMVRKEGVVTSEKGDFNEQNNQFTHGYSSERASNVISEPVNYDESEITVGIDEDGNEVLYDDSFNIEECVNSFAHACLPSKPFDETEFYKNVTNVVEDIVLVIGSETGLSNSAKKFTMDNCGQQVSIELHNGIDSLNTSVASGIIMYEILRQSKLAHLRKLEAEKKMAKQ